MKPTHRRWWMVAVAGLAAGCGGGDAPAPAVDVESVDPQGQEVVFWYQHQRARERALKEMIADFNGTNPHGIRVRGEFAGSYGDIYNKMVVGLQGGNVADLVVAYQNQAREYLLADGIVDLIPYMTSPRWGLSQAAAADYVGAFLNQDRIGCRQIALPPNRSIEVLYYNMDWLRELGAPGPPATWEEFARMCRAARDQPFSGNPAGVRSLGFVLEEDASRAASMTFSRGGDFLDPAGTSYRLDTPELTASLRLMQELATEGAVALMGEAYGDQTAFNIGEALFMLRSTSGLPFVQEGVASGADFDWGVAAPPQAGPEPVVNFYGASISVCRTTPERQLAAWLFLKWFTEPPQQARWVKASNYFPARRSTRRLLADYLEQNPRYASAYRLLEYGKAEPSLPGYEAVRRLISRAVVKALQGADVESTLSRLQQEAQATLQDY